LIIPADHLSQPRDGLLFVQLVPSCLLPWLQQHSKQDAIGDGRLHPGTATWQTGRSTRVVFYSFISFYSATKGQKAS